MVGAAIFTLVAISLTAALIQNERATRTLSYRTQAITITMGMVEQIRTISFLDLTNICNNVSAGTGTGDTIAVQIMDPANDSPDPDVPAGYRVIQLPINDLDGVSKKTSWFTTSIPLDTSTTAPRLPLRWWLRLSRRLSTTDPVCDVYELCLIYQWQMPGTPSAPWQSGVIRIVTPNDITT
jgi:hypothetical protein